MIRKLVLKISVAAASALVCISSNAQTAAFPGALGFGANVTGGRGGTVYHVTTLADSGAGSFRDAVSHSGRIIVFDVGGYIKLNSAVSCSGNLTIAGQTAPGGGIGFYGGEISFSSRSNIICRYIRIRPGSLTASTTDDALAMANARTMIFDHCSFEFGPWNNIDAVSSDWQTTPVTEITFQNCLNADPTYDAASPPPQGFGAHTESVSSTMSWFYNIFANSHNRNPLAKINTVFINNVEFNCSAGYTTHTSTSFSHDIVNNYFISGPASGGNFPWYQIDSNQSIYESGNLLDSNEDGALNGSPTSVYWYQGVGTELTSPWSSVTATTPTYSTVAAYRLAISRAGVLPRDQVDDLVISQMKTLGNAPTGTGAGTAGPDGGLYSSQTQTGLGNNGYGVINGGIAPIDTDNDGMPDYWEKAMGLNFSSASDAMTIGADGYANIERYLNWLADPHAFTVTNTPVDIDLWQYTSGFTNANPTYTVTILSNGVVTLNSGHIAHFTPAANFSGMGAFQFTVTGNDGTAWSNNVAVIASPVTPPSNLIWQGDGVANVWGNGTGVNWLNGTNLVAFSSGDSVTFDDTGTNTPAISLTGNLPATTVNVLAAQDYTFAGTGAISGGAALFKTGSGQLTILTTNTFAGGTTINDGIVQLGDGASANGSIVGSITNNDTLIYQNPGALSSSVNLAGYGALIKNASGALTLSGTHSFNGETTINAGSLQFSGTIPPCDISNNTSLIFAPSSFAIYTNVISGPGALTTSGSGVTILSSANTFSGGVANTSGFLILSNNSAAGTGTVTYSGGFVVVAAGIVVTNIYSIPGSSASDLCMMATNTGTATWAGDVNIGGSGQWRPGSDGGTLVFTGNAPLGSHYLIVPRGAMQFASNAVVSTTQTGCAFGRDLSGNNRSASITIKDNANVALGACSLGGGQAGGNVTLTIQNNAVLNCGASLDLQNVNRATAVTFVRLNGGTLITGGFTKTKTSQTNMIQFNGGVLKASGNNSAFIPSSFTFATNVVQSGGAIVDDSGFIIAIAIPLIHDASLGATADGGLTKLGAGTLTLAAHNTYTGPTIINAGTLALYAPPAGSISNSSSIYIAAGAQLDVSGGGTASMTLDSGKILWGNGSIKGHFTVGSGAIFSPGSNSIGALTVATSVFGNSLTLASGSTNIFEISHLPLTNDTVKIFGVLTNGGTLIVSNIGASSIAAGDTFKLFDATNYNGSFANVILPPLNSGLAWNTDSLNTNGVISVVSTVPPNPPVISAISISGNNLIFSGTGGVAGANFYLLGSSNLVSPLSDWTRLLTNQFDGSGNFNVTNSVDSSAPQNFFRLQEP
jgi:autotransporter-associated beta strand protein